MCGVWGAALQYLAFAYSLQESTTSVADLSTLLPPQNPIFFIASGYSEDLPPHPHPTSTTPPGPDIPEHLPSAVKEGILSRFASQSQSDRQKKTKYTMSRQQKDKLLSYILVLLLFLEKFSLDYASLAADLKITTSK